jgi:hypothetical protein
VGYEVHGGPNTLQRASPKGLLCGTSIRIRLEDGNVIIPSDEEVHTIRFLISIVTAALRPNVQACLIPHSEDIAAFDVDPELSWVLVVEKEVSMNDRG